MRVMEPFSYHVSLKMINGAKFLVFKTCCYEYQRIDFLLSDVQLSGREVSPTNTKYLYNICTLLVQRRRRLANVVQMLYKCFGVFWVIVFIFVKSQT